jgi:hypothetical protein
LKKRHALVFGATGATGKEIVCQLLKDITFDKVSIFVRTKSGIKHEKLVQHQIDFSKLESYKEFIQGDVLFSCLGTTLKDAGSKEQQFLIDYTYQYEFAKMASENGVTKYSLISSAGANKSSFFFYPKIKGQLEASVQKLSFNSIQIFQPPILIRPQELIRKGEKIAIAFFQKLNEFGLFKSQKPLPVSILAQRMISEIKTPQKEKIKIFKPTDIF